MNQIIFDSLYRQGKRFVEQINGKVAIIAGAGDLPLKVIASCKRDNIPVCVLLLRGFANPADYEPLNVTMDFTTIGTMGKTLRLLKHFAVDTVVFAGGVDRPTLANLKPDITGLLFFLRLSVDSLGDDGALSAVMAFFERKGYKVIGANSFIPYSHCVGPLGCHKPTVHDKKSITRGMAVLKILSPADVAQSIICQNGLVLGIEAIEGTDDLMARCAPFVRQDKAGAVLIKMQKHGQTTKADMPTLGITTVENAYRAGLAGIAFDASGTLLLDKDTMIAKADQLGLFLVAV